MKLLSKITLLTFCTVAFAGSAFAQACSTTDKDTYKTCVDDSVESCRTAAPSCDPYDPVLTLEDVRTLAIENCCGKAKKAARTLCLAREKQKYVTEVSSGSQRAFFRAARTNINDVRKNVCNNSSYTLPAESSLF